MRTLYETTFDPNASIYREFQPTGANTKLKGTRGNEPLAKSITSSSDTPFAEFIKAINATGWVRQGHEHFSETSDGKCPYCQRELPNSFEDDLASCFDEQYQVDINDLKAFQEAYIKSYLSTFGAGSICISYCNKTGCKQCRQSFARRRPGEVGHPFSHLTKSKDVAGAVRGYVHGGRGVAAQANLTKVDMTQITKTTAVANGVANVMNVGSLVVGQFYMTEISDKLEKMNHNINKISDFQNREFKSRIISLISRMKKYSGFSAEIIEKDETMLRILGILESIEGDATELLGQVNIEITDICNKNPAPAYQEYQETIDQLSVLVEYQDVLSSMLAEISKLTYLLGKGTVSSEMSYSVYNDYLAQSFDTRNILECWHDKQVEFT